MQMIGWWARSAPVRTGRRGVLATTYRGKGHSLIAVASWAPDTVSVRLDIDWRSLGIDRDHAHIRAPAIPGFQPAAAFRPGEPIPVPPGKGWLLIIE
jgi:hypothetical protein